MEFLDGKPLPRVCEALRKEKRRELPFALHVASGALAGLHHAHELSDLDGTPLQVVHRDMTPHNIFVTYEGQVKVVDFGIAKAFDSSTNTQVGTIKGKVAYLAPEQARGEVLDRRTDIFSLGVVLWEMLAGQPMWGNLSEVAIIGRLLQGAIPDLQRVRPDLPPSLAALVTRALSPKPELRPPSAQVFHDELAAEAARLSCRLSERELSALMQELFGQVRAQERRVVNEQLKALTGESSDRVPGSSSRAPRSQGARVGTPAGGWNLDVGRGSDPLGRHGLPDLGSDGNVHEAITLVHTGLSHQHPEGTWPSISRGAVRSSGAPPDRSTGSVSPMVWVTIIAVAVASTMIGVVQPWKAFIASGVTAGHATPTTDAKRPGPDPAPSHTLEGGCNAKSKPLVELTGEISQDAELSCDKDYLLRFTTYVTPGSTLRILPGTTILGDLETKGTLVIQPGARIEALGTAARPVVFTSAAPPEKRARGDWGGLVVLGEAPTNLRDAAGKPRTGNVEGLVTGGEYGGVDPNDSSGTLSYVRIEYSGTELGPNNELNGLTLGGVGRGTSIHHVQVRHSADDCFEFFGGTADAKYLVCQAPGDDAFDWDYGFSGRLQFLVGQAAPSTADGANGLEGDNDPNGSRNTPISYPLIYNLTLCGSNRRAESFEQYAILLRRGTGGRIRNGLFVGFSAGLDVRDLRTRPNIAASTFFGNLEHNLAFPEHPSKTKRDRALFDDDAGFDERAYLTTQGMKIGQYDPQLGSCFDTRAPDLKPKNPLKDNAAIPPDDGFFDPTASFVGAFRDKDDDWDQGGWVKWDR